MLRLLRKKVEEQIYSGVWKLNFFLRETVSEKASDQGWMVGR